MHSRKGEAKAGVLGGLHNQLKIGAIEDHLKQFSESYSISRKMILNV